MKILAITKEHSAIHLWRVKRPLDELQKHVDWQIDYQTQLIRDYKGMEQDPDGFIKKYGADEVRHLGQYDIVFCSYFTSPHLYALLWGAHKRYKTKFIIDFDDDLYDVDPSNFSFWQEAGWQGHEFLMTMAKITENISTTTQALADKIKANSETEPRIFVNPNYISDNFPDQEVDNGDKTVIGFFGGATHYNDLHKSGVFPAIRKLMHENKSVYFKICGQPVDDYLPRKRVEQVEVKYGEAWATDVLPSLNLDISIAPLLPTTFNKFKSNIKWQESTRMGSAFVATDYGAYSSLDPTTAVLVRNDEQSWYKALKELVDDVESRKTLVKNAKEALKAERLEDNYVKYKHMFEEVFNENNQSSK